MAAPRWTLQFANTDPKVFLDAMAFRDADHGFAFSDSVDGQFVILATANGGTTWNRVPANRLPPALPGEGAFAASGTNVAVVGATRVDWDDGVACVAIGRRRPHLDDAQTPIATGNATGIFSIAFRDAQHGVVVGGDYTKESQAGDNAAFTSDGGATWTLGKGISGFRSVAAWLPAASSLVAIGPAGAAGFDRRWPFVDVGADDRVRRRANRFRHAQRGARNLARLGDRRRWPHFETERRTALAASPESKFKPIVETAAAAPLALR